MKITEDNLRQLVSQDLNQYDIAIRLGVTQGAVCYALKRYNIIYKNKVRDQWGVNNHAFKNGLAKSTIERLIRRMLIEAGRDLFTCERCGFHTPYQELPKHHKDRDRSNNISSNLEVLCWGCHNREHMHEHNRNGLGQFVS